MGIVTRMFLIAAGAVMRFAVSAQVSGVNIPTAGVVLIVVGILGAVMSIGFWASWGGFWWTFGAPQPGARGPGLGRHLRPHCSSGSSSSPSTSN